MNSKELATSLGGASEDIVFSILIQIVVIIIFAKIISIISRKFLGQTDVAGEILAGILLGPSLLSSIFPEFFSAIFPSHTSTAFIALSQIGLIFLMFQIGMEFDFTKQLKKSKASLFFISSIGILFPFLLGFYTAGFLWELLPEPRPSLLGFKLFFSVAMSITAIPILGRIFMELNISNSRLASLIISAAAIDDVLGWLLLGTITMLVTSSFSIYPVIINISILILFAVVIFLLGTKLISPYITRSLKRNKSISSNTLFIVVTLLLICAITTSHLGVYAIIGGFIFGLSLHRNREFVYTWNHSIGRFVNVFFLPLFFAYTGLKTNVGLLNDLNDLLIILLVCSIAFIGKFGGTYLASRFVGENHSSALIIGFSMNTRALMELIVLNIGYDLGVLPQKMFTILVIMAVVSTFMITPILKYFVRHKKIETSHSINES
jgi:Kef-type K+ transport system membrane component KefB